MAQVLREDAQIARLLDEELVAEEETCRMLKQRIEQMGPVNMMALDEYKETAQRHEFLETPAQDLIESIENTPGHHQGIDQITRTKFDEAFAKINENFGVVFSRLSRAARPSCASPMPRTSRERP